MEEEVKEIEEVVEEVIDDDEASKKAKKKALLNLIYSIGGIVIFNSIIQFVLYPFLNRKMGDADFGVALTLLSVITIIASACGAAANNSRMVFPNSKDTKNGDYNLMIIFFNLVGMAVVITYLIIFKQLTWYNAIFLNLLMIATTFRYYADVEFRKSLKYLSFMIFYILIGVGYLIGCLTYLVFPYWQVSMLIGEVLALSFIFIKGNIFKNFFKMSNYNKQIWALCLSLVAGELIISATLNADRLVLYGIVGSEAVTTYYVASLVGKIVALVTVPLNGVIMGYLGKMKETPSKKFVSIYNGVVLGFGILAFFGCWLVSPLFIKILYPTSYETVKPILLYAIGAQSLFFCGCLSLTLIIKFMKARVQLIVNIVSLVIFAAITIVFSIFWGLEGFAIGALIGNLIKVVLVVIVSYTIKHRAIEQIVEAE